VCEHRSRSKRGACAKERFSTSSTTPSGGRDSLYAITAPTSEGASPTILSPHPLETLTFEQLRENEQREVLRAWTSRQCQCQLCEYYRPRAPKYLAKREEREARAAKKAAKAKQKAKRAAKKKPTK
jgi:hypothetical protein